MVRKIVGKGGGRAVCVFETRIVRENGDTDMLVLCRRCIGTIRDYATISGTAPIAGRCERCEGEQ